MSHALQLNGNQPTTPCSCEECSVATREPSRRFPAPPRAAAVLLPAHTRQSGRGRGRAPAGLHQSAPSLLHGTAPRELRPWLYTIARNCLPVGDHRRRATTPLEDHTPALAGLSDQVHQREDLRELVAEIGRLPEDQRSALLLAELDDLSHQAIATIVGCK